MAASCDTSSTSSDITCCCSSHSLFTPATAVWVSSNCFLQWIVQVSPTIQFDRGNQWWKDCRLGRKCGSRLIFHMHTVYFQYKAFQIQYYRTVVTKLEKPSLLKQDEGWGQLVDLNGCQHTVSLLYLGFPACLQHQPFQPPLFSLPPPARSYTFITNFSHNSVFICSNLSTSSLISLHPKLMFFLFHSL